MEKQDVTGSSCLKDATGKMVVDKNGTKRYMEETYGKFDNEDNVWDHAVSSDVAEGSALQIV